MPAWVSQHSDAVKKQNLIEKRLRRLRAAVREGEGSIHVSQAAEKVRLAALALIKAKRALIREYPQRDPDGRQSWNLQDEEQRWLAVSAEMIVEEYGRDQAK
jgi:hypothetical protein